MSKLRNSMAVAALVSTVGVSASALQPLHENPTVVGGFYAIGLADELRKNCDDLRPRWLRAYNYLKSLEKFALDQGYTPAQIEDLTDNREEKERQDCC